MSVTWNSYYETQPPGGDAPRQGDDQLRELKQAIRERFAKEHESDLDSGVLASEGYHLEGSAVGYVASSAPTTTPAGDALAAIDDGRIWYDDGEYLLPKVRSGNAWSPYMRDVARFTFQGSLGTGTSAGVPLIFPRAAAIKRVAAKVGTAPTGQSLIIDLHRMGASGTDAGSIFASDGVRLTIASSATFDDKDYDSSELDATNAAIAYQEYIKIDIDQVGSTVAGADLCIAVEAVLG